jgi:hypothetical protein
MGFVPARMVPGLGGDARSSRAGQQRGDGDRVCGRGRMRITGAIDVVMPSCECSSRARRRRDAVAACRAHQDHLALAAGIADHRVTVSWNT